VSKTVTGQRNQPQQTNRPKNPQRVVKKKDKMLPGRWLWIWLGLTGVAMASAMAGALLAVSLSEPPLQQTTLTPEEDAVFSKEETLSRQSLRLPELTRPVNILILGVKVLSSEVDDPELQNQNLGYHALVNSFKGLSDTMLLLRFDPDQGKFTVLSLPRDTQTYVEGAGLTKLNEANYYGGPALAAKSVSDLLEGVPIDRYIRVNVQAVEKFIDALGGVEVYVPKDMKYTDHSQHLYIDLKEGQQHLDGQKAMQFLRFRYDQYGDIGRVQRQQMLIRSLVEQALKPQTLIRMPEIVSIVQSYIDTNLSVEEIIALCGFASQKDRSNVQMLMLPGYFNGDGKQEVSFWIPNRRRIKDLMTVHFSQGYSLVESASPSRINIAIQDSTQDPDAVQAVISHLQEAGYSRIFVGDKWNQPLQETRIVAQQGDDMTANVVQSALGFGEVLVESTGSLASDVTIQLGNDWQQLLKTRTIQSQGMADDVVSF
jgi:polyisoprenyl-teichoic acid--peptidoglycan teichoic acid transferase